jgi:hypothetical protein
VFHGCHTPTHTETVVSGLSSCATSAPDPGQDATSIVQEAIVGGCTLAAGVYEITTPAPVAGRRRYDMLTVGPGQSLCGSGSGTALRFSGDAAGQDWRGISLAGELCDLTIDTSALAGTSEQTHAVRVPPGTTGARVHGVTWNHPIRGLLAGGDCIDLVGYAATPVRDVVIRDNTFAHCDRASIQVHSGTVGLTIERNQFLDTGDFDINSEPGGDSSDWLVSANVFKASASNQGAFAVAFDLVSGARLVGNTMERGVYLYGCQGCAIVGNTISAQSGHSGSQGAIDAVKGTSDLLIAENTVSRASTMDTGPVIHVGPHGTEQAKGVRIIHNALSQFTPTDIVYLEGVSDACIADNDVSYGAAGLASGIRLMGSGGDAGTPINDVSITDNAFTGPLRWAIYTAGSANRQGSGAILAGHNRSSGPGLHCENMFGVKGPITLDHNSWGLDTCGVPSLAVTVP